MDKFISIGKLIASFIIGAIIAWFLLRFVFGPIRHHSYSSPEQTQSTDK